MNFLAHIFLSGNNDLIKIGNFMADGIRGNQYKNFPIEIQHGVILHRAIDTFTDNHPLFRQSTKRLHAHYGHYSGVIVDIYYDHFLAKRWKEYSSIPLNDYATHFYNILEQHRTILTEKTLYLLPYMKTENWLLLYETISGIKQILIQMDHRTKNNSKMRLATDQLKLYYIDFEMEFVSFFEEIKSFVNKFTIQI